MIIAVTGTPGTGKDTISKLLAKSLNFGLVDLNKLAREKNLLKGYDEKRKCDVVDIQGLAKEAKKLKGNQIIQSHYSHLLPSDLIIVLRTGPAELRKRLEKRGWPNEKIQENMDAEIMEICKSEAMEKPTPVLEVDNTGDVKLTEEKIINSFPLKLVSGKTIKLTGKNIQEFKGPYGTLFGSAAEAVKHIEKKNPAKIVSVGDAASYSLLSAGVLPDMIIVDNKERRLPFTKNISFSGKELKTINEPGTISSGLWATVQKGMQTSGKVKISVAGEEDLAVLPAVIMAPLGSVVLYGQPPLGGEGGLVLVEVTREKKAHALRLLEKLKNSAR